MKLEEEKLREAMNRRLGALQADEVRRARIRQRIEQEEEPIMKRKISFGAVVAFAVMALATIAMAAAAGRMGLLDFLGRGYGVEVPENAESFILQDGTPFENEIFSAVVRERYYDGRVLRMTVDAMPKEENTLFMGEDVEPLDPWANLSGNVSAEGETVDERKSIAEVMRERGIQKAWGIDLWLADDDALAGAGASMDFALQEDGTLTIFLSVLFEENAPEREVTVVLAARQWLQDEQGRWRMDGDHLERAQTTLTLRASNTDEALERRFTSHEPVIYGDAGVQIDRLTLTVKPMEILARVEFSVIDEATYAQTDDGLWFEFIDPAIETDEYAMQRLKSGPLSVGSVTLIDATHFVQEESLAASELRDVYTVRGFNCWEKGRYDTHDIPVFPEEPSSGE